jgi:cobalt-zinc-cadmium efflux system protein
VRAYLAGLPGVESVHDLHVWGLSTAETALTAHLVKPDPCDDDALAEQATDELEARFDIDHVTLQWERGGLDACRERACDREIRELPEEE